MHCIIEHNTVSLQLLLNLGTKLFRFLQKIEVLVIVADRPLSSVKLLPDLLHVVV